MISKRKFCRQSFSKYFETFWWLNEFFFHHKWNEAWFILINWYIWVVSRVAERLKTCDLSYEISEKSQTFIELLLSAQSSRNENFASTSKSFQKYRNLTFLAVCYFTWKLEFFSNILWIIACTHCHLFAKLSEDEGTIANW